MNKNNGNFKQNEKNKAGAEEGHKRSFWSVIQVIYLILAHKTTKRRCR